MRSDALVGPAVALSFQAINVWPLGDILAVPKILYAMAASPSASSAFYLLFLGSASARRPLRVPVPGCVPRS